MIGEATNWAKAKREFIIPISVAVKCNSFLINGMTGMTKLIPRQTRNSLKIKIKMARFVFFVTAAHPFSDF